MAERPAARTRTVSWPDPRVITEVAERSNGLDFLRALIEGRVPNAPFFEILGFRPTEAEEGRVVLSGETGEHLVNAAGSIHGGYMATLVDTATALALRTTLPVGRSLASMEVKVNYLRPLAATTGTILCEGRVVHPGRRVATAEARVADGTGRLYAHGLSTCLVFDR